MSAYLVDEQHLQFPSSEAGLKATTPSANMAGHPGVVKTEDETVKHSYVSTLYRSLNGLTERPFHQLGYSGTVYAHEYSTRVECWAE
jgi:hypothetical protein